FSHIFLVGIDHKACSNTFRNRNVFTHQRQSDNSIMIDLCLKVNEHWQCIYKTQTDSGTLVFVILLSEKISFVFVHSNFTVTPIETYKRHKPLHFIYVSA